MTATINLPADIEADLADRARVYGLELARYLELLLREQVRPRPGPRHLAGRAGRRMA